MESITKGKDYAKLSHDEQALNFAVLFRLTDNHLVRVKLLQILEIISQKEEQSALSVLDICFPPKKNALEHSYKYTKSTGGNKMIAMESIYKGRNYAKISYHEQAMDFSFLCKMTDCHLVRVGLLQILEVISQMDEQS